MCGIAGIWQPSNSAAQESSPITRMLDAIAHRGPDDRGVWRDMNTGLSLGHCRLSIVDLSPAGAQPMATSDGRKCLTYNGEIYNFEVLRASLRRRGISFKGTSDTEVLLTLLEREGVLSTLPQLNGMFAFAFWDADRQRLTLARDAFGKKPLLYELTGSHLRFGSELTSFLACSNLDEKPALDPDVARMMMAFGVVPEPFSILKGIYKLPPGHVLEIWRSNDGGLGHRQIRWYEPQQVSISNGTTSLDRFEDIFADAISMRLSADVPVGAFLSGGIDSSLVVATAHRQLNEPLKTFTVGFDIEGYDESHHAEAIAKYLGTDHHSLRLSIGNIEDNLLEAAGWFDEPFADASAIPTRAVAAFAREFVKVVLTGDGGDENFLGYPLHRKNTSMVSVLEHVPAAPRRIVANIARGLAGRRVRWHANALRQVRPELFYLSQRSGDFELPTDALSTLAKRLPPLRRRSSNAEWLGACDFSMYLVDDMLAKVDRATMSVGLEARNPLLDRRIVSMAQSLPLGEKINSQRGKLLLRRALDKVYPNGLFERPKIGLPQPDRLLAQLKTHARLVAGQSQSLRSEIRMDHPAWADGTRSLEGE